MDIMTTFVVTKTNGRKISIDMKDIDSISEILTQEKGEYATVIIFKGNHILDRVEVKENSEEILKRAFAQKAEFERSIVSAKNGEMRNVNLFGSR